MKFVLELWPDDDDLDPHDLVAFAVQSVKDNPELRWDVLDEDGKVVAEGISGLPRLKWTCRHCGRSIELDEQDGWVCPEAGTDVENGDGMWRTTCEDHDTVTAEHEPERSCERCSAEPVVDQDSGLGANCIANNEGRVIL